MYYHTQQNVELWPELRSVEVFSPDSGGESPMKVHWEKRCDRERAHYAPVQTLALLRGLSKLCKQNNLYTRVISTGAHLHMRSQLREEKLLVLCVCPCSMGSVVMEAWGIKKTACQFLM